MKRVHASVTYDRVWDACRRRDVSLDDPGFCLECGLEHYGMEPDARECECESCGERRVFGAEEILLMQMYAS